MERDKYLKEIELTLDEIVKDEDLIVIIKETLDKRERNEVFNSFRYGTILGESMSKEVSPVAGEEHYNKIIKIKKARNLIDYLLLLAQNKDS
tara:strand:+ start:2375 stop:2650 length:276 start_codon:yes stop_codon:yes gene_type:complete